MRKILRLTKREYLAAVKTKGFIIMLILMPILMGGSGIAMYLFQGQVDTRDKKVIIIDRSGILADMILIAAEDRNREAVFNPETGKKAQPAFLFEVVPANQNEQLQQRLQLSNLVREEKLHAFLEIEPEILHPSGDTETFRIKYYARSSAMDNIRMWLNDLINPWLRAQRLQEAGVDISKANEIMTWIQVEPLGLVSMDEETGEIQDARKNSEEEAFLVPMILFFLMFMMVMMGAMPLLQSTMEEKNQRIAEVLLGSLKPHEFMAGKVLGGLGVSLTGASFYVVGGIFFLKKLGLAPFIPFSVIPWFFTFLVLEIIMVGSYLAALGAACNDPKDAQNLSFPAMFPVFLPMFLFMPILQEPSSAFATGLSLFPLFTPMLMLLRISAPVAVPAWQPWAGLAGVLLFTVFSVWMGGRIFRAGILMQGGPPKLSKIFRWAFRG